MIQIFMRLSSAGTEVEKLEMFERFIKDDLPKDVNVTFRMQLIEGLEVSIRSRV